MKNNSDSIRSKSNRVLSRLGFPSLPEHFPLIESRKLRPTPEIVERALILNVVINVAYGMPPDLAIEWLNTNNVNNLTDEEENFINLVRSGESCENPEFTTKVEALWALAWCLSIVHKLEFDSYCGENLAGLLPELRESESADQFKSKAVLRSPSEIYQALDTAYCLSWGIVESNLTNSAQPGNLHQYVYWERRRALEWCFGDDWDEPNLST